MPSLDWNRRWGREFTTFQRRQSGRLYGTQWGDPRARGRAYWAQRIRHPLQIPGRLYKVVEEYIDPYVTPETVALEIGSGGGRWTQFLVNARKVIAVDINNEFFEPLRGRFPEANLEFYRPAGCDLKGIGDAVIDFVFTFGTFVHIDPEGIRDYLGEIKRVLRPGGIAVVHYSDKRKLVARLYRGFSHMTAPLMEGLAPMTIIRHETRLLSHSNIVVMQKPRSSDTDTVLSSSGR